jgi:hypothetical protein
LNGQRGRREYVKMSYLISPVSTVLMLQVIHWLGKGGCYFYSRPMVRGVKMTHQVVHTAGLGKPDLGSKSVPLKQGEGQVVVLILIIWPRSKPTGRHKI